MEKITTRDISFGIKISYFLISVAISACTCAVFISYSSGQVVQQVDTLKQNVNALQTRVAEDAKVKEQMAIDIAVIKTEMKNSNESLTEIKEMLKMKKPWKAGEANLNDE